jgi:hypothetical protein
LAVDLISQGKEKKKRAQWRRRRSALGFFQAWKLGLIAIAVAVGLHPQALPHLHGLTGLVPSLYLQLYSCSTGPPAQ